MKFTITCLDSNQDLLSDLWLSPPIKEMRLKHNYLGISIQRPLGNLNKLDLKNHVKCSKSCKLAGMRMSVSRWRYSSETQHSGYLSEELKVCPTSRWAGLLTLLPTPRPYVGLRVFPLSNYSRVMPVC